MGVKTSVWGRYAWLTCEGVARTFDDFMARRDITEYDQQLMLSLGKEFFFLVGFVVPCIFCRISYQQFTEPHSPNNHETDIYKMLRLKNGAKKLVYNLHNRVSRKLRDQERAKANGDHDKLRQVNAKWQRKHLTYVQALAQQFPPVTSKRFWNGLIVFLAMIMCDFRPQDSSYIYQFYWVLGKILCLVAKYDEGVGQIACTYTEALRATLDSWSPSMDIATRFDIVWRIKNPIFKLSGWSFSRTRLDFQRECQKAIVGCVKK